MKSYKSQIEKILAREHVVDRKVIEYRQMLVFWTDEQNIEKLQEYYALLEARYQELGV